MSEAMEALGQRLQAAREKKSLTAQKAADELHLDGWVITGLESGDYARIGPAVYAKGHLKRYAELLGLPVAEILEVFDGRPPAEEVPVQPATMRLRTTAPAAARMPWLPILGALIVVLLLGAGIVGWRAWHSRAALGASPVGAPAAPASRDDGAGTTPGTGSPSGVAIPGVATPGATTPGVATPGTSVPAGAAAMAIPVPVAPADPNAGSGRARLRLSFLGTSWVDVHDAAGQRLFAGNGHVNNVRSLSGDAPFRVYIKSASSIRLEINNHVVVIGPQFISGDAAHFEAGADGVLRRDPKAVSAAPAAPADTRPRG